MYSLLPYCVGVGYPFQDELYYYINFHKTFPDVTFLISLEFADGIKLCLLFRVSIDFQTLEISSQERTFRRGICGKILLAMIKL